MKNIRKYNSFAKLLLICFMLYGVNKFTWIVSHVCEQ